ncbi:IS3 family transposase [Flammeovirgaceae bacterium SG7u.132]|nr:IS3 family transposase [Flammeovirgaceae bacterium SG7u.132]
MGGPGRKQLYYHKPSGGRKGNRPSVETYHQTKGYVGEQEVLGSIKAILGHEFIDCGYRLMASYLQKGGYRINHKKVYRIMKQAGLLKTADRIDRGGAGRKVVEFRKVKTSRPMECLEMDIKMVWIPAMGKNAYLLSLIDVHTRRILGGMFSFSIKQEQVIGFLSAVLEEYECPGNVVIRSDNGSQFIATRVREYLGLVGVGQEFTHVATPEENAHIEAYHGILRQDVFDRVEYTAFGEIEQVLKRYVHFYNHDRLHGLLGKVTPIEKWEACEHLILPRKKTA